MELERTSEPEPEVANATTNAIPVYVIARELKKMDNTGNRGFDPAFRVRRGSPYYSSSVLVIGVFLAGRDCGTGGSLATLATATALTIRLALRTGDHRLGSSIGRTPFASRS